MSVQFGRWNFDGAPHPPDLLLKVESAIRPHAPDGISYYSDRHASILYGAFHITKESQQESQPHVSSSNTVFTWDGRLDNRADLLSELAIVPASVPDVQIVSAAYERWGTRGLAKLIGDWALGIWSPNARTLLLARDVVGVRQLYYSVEKDRVTWSTILDPLVLSYSGTVSANEEYIAGWLSSSPAAHLSPYTGIHSVPPSCFVRLEGEKRVIQSYWDFDPGHRISYRRDADYEEHFRTVFGESVRRRLRSHPPILAELSGGMDSSSIVCVADVLLAKGNAETARLDTLSYYDDSEPNWNERPFFTMVESQRGRTGCHINVGLEDSFCVGYRRDRFAASPASARLRTSTARQVADLFDSQNHRVLLSGVGGDELLGGVPTPVPELADLFATVQFRKLGFRTHAWALAQRKPLLHLCRETLRIFLPPELRGSGGAAKTPDWIRPDFVHSNSAAFSGYESRTRLSGALPSFQMNLEALQLLRRQLGSLVASCDPPYERRYPFLDRDLLAFIYAIPREQLLRPNERRSLMRRSLRSVVPQQILERKRKAFVERTPVRKIAAQWPSLQAAVQDMKTVSLGIVDARRFLRALEQAKQGMAFSTIPIERTFALEMWLQHLDAWNVADSRPESPPQSTARSAHAKAGALLKKSLS